MTGPELALLAETVLGCVTGLVLLVVLIACAAVKYGWVRFSLSFAVLPLERRGQAPAAAQEQAPAAVPVKAA